MTRPPADEDGPAMCSVVEVAKGSITWTVTIDTGNKMCSGKLFHFEEDVERIQKRARNGLMEAASRLTAPTDGDAEDKHIKIALGRDMWVKALH